MTAYKNRNEIYDELDQILPQQIATCKRESELPAPLKDLILHNFQAKFVCFDKATKTIEIGVDKEAPSNDYPEIETLKFSLKDIKSQLGKTYRKEDQDLQFYAKIIGRTNSDVQIDEMVLV